MGLFDGINDAEVFERGKFIPPDFKGVLEVKRTLAKESIKSGVGFIVEFEVVSVERAGDPQYNSAEAPVPVRVGEKRTWWQGMKDKTVAFPAIKTFAAALAGYTADQKDEIESDVAPHLQALLQRATDNPADNDLCGQMVEVETMHKLTKSKKDFTVHNWIPYTEAAE